VGNSATVRSQQTVYGCFAPFFQIGTALEMKGHGSSGGPLTIRGKGRIQMFGTKFSNQIFAAVAALLMSSIAVGATVAPEAVAATSVNVVSYV
jgi:hypothetical protein